ncbi:MAG TPA: hypothetical protein VGG28_31505 [Kofleriaceae bacterium]|jgi:hypothetical protein
MKAILAVAMLAGCYSYTKPVVAPAAVASATTAVSHARVGCVDIEMTRIARAPTPIVSYSFTNTCDYEARVDSSAYELQTVVVDAGGDWTKLWPVQRRHQNSTWTGYRLDPHETEVAERTFRGGGLDASAKICTDVGAADSRVAYQPHWTCVHY